MYNNSLSALLAIALHLEPMHEVLNYSSVDIHFIVLLTVFEVPREFPTVQL